MAAKSAESKRSVMSSADQLHADREAVVGAGTAAAGSPTALASVQG